MMNIMRSSVTIMFAAVIGLALVYMSAPHDGRTMLGDRFGHSRLLTNLLPPAFAQFGRLPLDKVEVVTQSGKRHKFTVELATKPMDRSRGMKGRWSMRDEEGMLFIFSERQILRFWMQDTFIPLDIIFLDENGKIVNIADNTTPLSEESIPSSAPAKYVLEIKGGLSAKLGIRAGDQVMLPKLSS